ncbi:MAG: hypothetical protein LBS21_11455 [Clostridiales bacterium]|jgi:hypothetical protein|nr:hypothetical protein [Clostridiales bacterium]
MQAYEFYAKPENGNIAIPDNYRHLITDEITVIILDKKPSLFEHEKINSMRKTELLSPPMLKTKGWKFDREEANER